MTNPTTHGVTLREALQDAWAGFVNLSADMEDGPLKKQMREHAKRIDAALSHLPAPEQPNREFAKHQSCGCVVCTCEDEERCHGCGAKNCGTHPVGEFPNPVFATPTAEPVGEPGAWVPDMAHLANEWADAATNGPTYLDNVRDGIYTFEQAKEMMKRDFAHCREVGKRVRSASPAAPEAAKQFQPARDCGCKTAEDCDGFCRHGAPEAAKRMNLNITKEWLGDKLVAGDDANVSAGRPCDAPPGCNAGNCLECDDFKAAKPEQQAQAGEPEVMAWMWQHDETTRTGFVEAWQLENGWEEQNPRCKIVGPLITLQSHREAMAETEEMNRQLREQNEAVDAACAELEQAITKKDAALLACVEALENANGNGHFPMFDAAITQAEEALK